MLSTLSRTTLPVIIVFSAGCLSRQAPVDTQQYPLPIYARAQDIQESYSVQVAYRVEISFPAREVIDFYAKKLGEAGFRPYTDQGIGSPEWKSFKDQTLPGSPLVHQLLAGWRRDSDAAHYVLSLRYETLAADFGASPGNHDLQVGLFVGPISGRVLEPATARPSLAVDSGFP